MSGGLYFDHASTSPPYQESLDLFNQISRDYFGNPSSLHSSGTKAKNYYQQTKEKFCETLNFSDGLFIQTSSATESNNLIIQNFKKNHPNGKIYLGHDVHASLWFCKTLYPESTTLIPLKPCGQYHFEEIDLDSSSPKLVLINTISQDIGTLHNIQPWHKLAQSPQLHLHVDATQAAGKIPINCDLLPFDSLSFSAHKFGGLRGCGALLLREVELTPLIYGGNQEYNTRSGTENIAVLAASELAYQLSLKQYTQNKDHLIQLDQLLLEQLSSDVTAPITQNIPEVKLPGLNNLSFPNYSGTELVAFLSKHHIDVSTGSACSEEKKEPSRTLLALGKSEAESLGSLRISFGIHHTEKDVTQLTTTLSQAILELKV